jgi:hypothetical protein
MVLFKLIRSNHAMPFTGITPGIIPRLIAIGTVGIIILGAVISFIVDFINKSTNNDSALGLLEGALLIV